MSDPQDVGDHGAPPEAAWRALLDQLPVAACCCDTEGRITAFNRRAVELWGRRPASDEDADRLCGSASRPAAGSSARELVIERPDGERRRAVAHATRLRDAAGGIAGTLHVLVDVTPLARAEERLTGLLESIDDHFVQYDRQWRYTFITEKGAAFIGRRREELLGRSIWELFPEAIGNPYYQKLHEAAATGRTVRFEFYYEPFDRWFHNHIYPTAEGISVFTTEITQRKKAEQALEAAEARHAALLELVPAGVYRCDADGRVRYYNRRATELWGRAPDLDTEEVRFCGSLRLFSIDGEPLPHEHCPVNDVLKTGMPVRNQEVMIERPDGSRITALVNVDALFDPSGRVAGAVNVFQDVTARRQVEEVQTRLAALVESSQDAIIGKDLDGRVTSWNRAAEQLYGYRADEMIGKPLMLLYPPEQAAEEDRILERMRAGERVERLETTRLHRSGARVEVSVTVSPVRDAAGRIVGASSVSHDIGERKAHDRALRESEERYRSLAEASGAIVYVANTDAEWITPQPAWEAYTGQTFEQYRGHGWAAAIHPEDRPRIQASIAEALAAGSVWHAEGRLWHAASQGYRHQEARAVPIRDAGGTVREWVGTCLDVHARRMAEESVREADRRKDEFLAVLAHELRNPLAPIVSSLQIMRLPNAATAQASVLDVLDRQVHHLVRLVDDLMEVSRITRGAIELRREPVSVEEAVRAAIEISRPLIDVHGHRLELATPSALLIVNGDQVRLTQIIANLLNNAAKYTPRGGLIKVSIAARDAEARVSVADNGPGIPPHLQQEVFEMFRRGTGAMERFASGLGIGLGLARKLAELHRGTIQLHSAGPGSGCEFTLRLPLASTVPAAARRAETEPAAAPARRVLVVDDNTDAAMSLAVLLRALGHDVRTAHHGSDALRVAEQFRPHLALLDLGMPDVDGFELAREIRGRSWGADIRLVALSGWGQDADRRRSRESGFDLHLVKPVGIDEVRKVLLTH